MYVLYVVFMYFNERLEMWWVPRINMACRCNSTQVQSETTVLYNKLPANGMQAENGASNARLKAFVDTAFSFRSFLFDNVGTSISRI